MSQSTIAHIRRAHFALLSAGNRYARLSKLQGQFDLWNPEHKTSVLNRMKLEGARRRWRRMLRKYLPIEEDH